MISTPTPRESDDHDPATPDPPPGQLTRRQWWAAGGVVAFVAIAATTTMLLTSGDITNTTAAPSTTAAPTRTATTPATFPIRGSFRILNPTARQADFYCQGQGGYSDLRTGAQVTLYSAKDEIIGIGKLLDNVTKSGNDCLFTFVITDAPKGHDFYQIEVTHRGKVRYSAEDVRLGKINLSIGG